MLAVFTCIQQEHNFKLIIVAALICLASVVTAFAGYRRALKVVGRFRIGWIGFTGLVGGSGVWATHFIAMLAYQPGLEIRYEPVATAASLLLSVTAVAAGFYAAMSRPDRIGRAAGGALSGLGIGLMHFTGMGAVRTYASLLWDPTYVGASLMIGAAGAAAAFLAAGALGSRRQIAAGSGLMVGAICGLHFTAMAAVTLLPEPDVVLAASFIGRPLLAVAVAILVAMMLLAGAALLWMERLTSVATLSSLRDALDGAPSALAFFDNANRLIFWNEKYRDVLAAFDLQPAVGLSDRQIFRAVAKASIESPSPWRAGWEAAFAQAETDRACEFHLPDGRSMRGEIGATSDGGVVAVFYDVTDQVEIARVLAEAKDKAEAANQAKSDFLAMMSHEIRTPLNGILGMAQAMQAAEPTATQGEQLKVIRRSGEILLRILNDVLDLAKIEAGQLQFEDRDFDIEHLVRGSLAVFAPVASQKNIDLKLHLEPEATGAYRGDGTRVRQLLDNLLSNAVKFTERGQIVLSVTCRQGDLCICVADTGIGIAAEHMPTLFEKFTQGDASTTRRFGGTGLGLSICAELARLMGGSITAESTEGVGSMFTLRLPMRCVGPAAQAGARTAPALEAAESPRQIKVLAAEDNEVNQLVIRTLLNQAGIEPTIVENGAEALAAWRREEWDVILLDVQMPQMDGPTAARAIRAGEHAASRRRTPIIAVTANAMVHQLADYKDAGMDEVVTKPLQAALLYEALERALATAAEASSAAA